MSLVVLFGAAELLRDTELMRIGVSISSNHTADGPQLMIDRARVAHRAGFASMTIGDHHNMESGYAQNTPMLGRLLAEWTDRPAGCLFIVPLWHPLLMAEHIGTLAAIHPDRFIVQIGIGHGVDQFEAFGTSEATRGRVMDEAIPIVKQLLAGEIVDSGFFTIVGGRVGLRPQGNIEWWISAGADVALRRAATMGDVWYGSPSVDIEQGRRMLDTYRAAGGDRAVVRKDALVLHDGDRARAKAEELVAAGYRGLRMHQLIVGNSDDAAEQLAAYEAVGFEEVVVRCMTVSQDDAIETLELVGSTVS